MPPRPPVHLSESQFDRLVDGDAFICMACGAIGPYDANCADGSEHQLISIVDAEASGVVEVDFPADD